MTDTRAALYCRISQREADVDKTANQEAKLRALAAHEGYVVAEAFVDDDLSAYRGKLARPGWTKMLAGIQDGKFDVIMATAPDRFTRGSAAELEALSMTCVSAGAVVHTVSGGRQDPSTPMVRGMLGITDILGGLEQDIKIQKQNERNEADLALGLVLPTRTPFGFTSEKGRVVGINEAEANLIRKAYASVLQTDNESLYSIAKSWSTPERAWTSNAVRTVLLRDRNAGWLTYRGTRIQQNQPAIVEQELHDTLVAHLTDPSRTPKRGPKEGTLLSGILRCVCGGGMTYVSAEQIYKCSTRIGGAGHKHQTVKAEVAEAKVSKAVLQHISDGSLKATEEAPNLSSVQARIRENSRQTDAASDLLMDPDVKDKSRPKARVLALEAELAALEVERNAVVVARAQGSAFATFREYVLNMSTGEGGPLIWLLAAEKLGQKAWDDLSLDKKRAIVRGSFSVAVSSDAGLKGAERVIVSLI